MIFSVILPMPPTTNNLFVNVGKSRKPSEQYVAWMRNAILETFAQVPAANRIGGLITITMQVPAKTPGDIDNRIKAAVDCLVKSRRIDDDKNVWSITITRSHLLKEGVRITVEAAE